MPAAIWGVIDFNKGLVDESIITDIEASYHNYKIDRFDKIVLDNVAVGCCHQFLTKEAFCEELPFYDKSKDILFTADCMLDNRNELYEHFPEISKDAPDSAFLYAAFTKWGTSLGDYVLGAYVFSAYYVKENKLIIWGDHMCNRSLFYHYENGRLIFSTAIVPLARAIHATPCEKWLTGCLSTTSADMMVFEKITPFEGVLQLGAGCYLSVTSSDVKETRYWSPFNINKQLQFNDSESVGKAFRDTFEKAVSSMLRSTENVGCTLSAGLDSSSVACVAAGILKDKKLYSYTSVPLSGFSEKMEAGQFADERPGVQLICEKYSNIEPCFVACENKDAFSEISRLIPLIGYPMKSGHNMTWLDEIYSRASDNNCKVMLKGQFGNSTISYGPILTAIYQKICSFKPLQAYRLMTGFGKRYGVPRKKIIEFFFKELKDKIMPVSLERMTMLADESFERKYGIKKQIKKIIKSVGGGQMDSRRQRLMFMAGQCPLMQLGMFDTIQGLNYGLIVRDPTKDKRVVEFCAALPIEYNVAGYLERGLVRTYMKGIVPDKILLNIYSRGVQSADYAYRSRILWEQQQAEVFDMIETLKQTQNIVNARDIEAFVEELKKKESSQIEKQDFIKANVLYSYAHFVKTFG